MIGEDGLSRLIGRVYAAALQPELWDSTLEAISDALGGAGLNIALIDVRKEARFFIGATRLDEGLSRRFLHNPTYIEPIRAKWMAGLTTSPVGKLVHREAFWSDAEFRMSAIFNDIIGPQGLWHWGFAPLALEGEVLVPFSVLRAPGEPLFDARSADILSRLLPHMARALQVSLRLDTLRTHIRSLDTLIDRLPIGVILVDSAASVLRCNQAAEGILSAVDGLTVSRGILAAEMPGESARLRRLIGEAAQTGMGQGTSQGGAMSLSRRSHKRSLTVLIAPLSIDGGSFEVRGARAVVFVSDPDAKPRLPGEVLAQLYGLTSRQASLAWRLAQGDTLAAAADALGISRNTARSHLRLILGKTGSSRQSELIRLITMNAAAIDKL